MEDKCMNFAIRITNLCRFLIDEKHEHKISDQLFRSGTSIGANMAEAQSIKECNETLFWLTLLRKTGSLDSKQYQSIYDDCEELKRLLVSITKTSKYNLDNEIINN